MIETISPLMRQALDQGRTLLHFVILWLSVMSKTIETEDDFLACDSLVNVDWDSEPGTAKIAVSESVYDISQLASDSTQQVLDTGIPTYMTLFQTFSLSPGRKLSAIKIKVKNDTGAITPLHVRLFSGDTAGWLKLSYDNRHWFFHQQWAGLPGLVLEREQDVAIGYDGVVTFTISPAIDLPQGTYTLNVSAEAFYSPSFKVYYNSANTFPGGTLTKLWNHPYAYAYEIFFFNMSTLGALYFDLDLSGYEPSGMRILSDTKDMGEVPIDEGVFTASYEQPLGTSVTFNLYASTTGAFAGEETEYANVDDGFVCPAGFRYWKIEVIGMPDSTSALTPRIESLAITFPTNPLRLREKDRPLRYADKSLMDFRPMISAPEFSVSDVDTTERVATGGSASCTLYDPRGDEIRRILADHPLKNYRYMMYLGADMPGFGEKQLLRWSVGTMSPSGYKPKYRRETTELPLSLDNSILQLTQKAPIAGETGLVSAENVSVDYDNVHVMDAMLDLIRGKAGIEPRYVNVQSFLDGKTTIGDADGPASLYRIRRGYHATLPDTRIKSPEEVRTFLKELCLIADGYIGIDETSRIYFFKHDKTGTAVATWADEKLVRHGYAAVPIEDISDIDLGYDSRIFTACMMGYGWTGSSDDKWENFTRYCYVDADAADEWSMGDSVWINLMEKNLKAASKWLGPQSGYMGGSICAQLTKRYTNRFKYPPMLLKGVRVHQREFVRNMGDVIHIRSDEIARFRKRRIPDGDPTNFMIVKKTLDRDACRVSFDLMELT